MQIFDLKNLLVVVVSRVAGTMVMRLPVRIRAKSHLCTCLRGSDRLRTGYQEVSMCSTRGGSRRMLRKKEHNAGPTLALNARGDVTRIQNREPVPPKKGHVSAKNI